MSKCTERRKIVVVTSKSIIPYLRAREDIISLYPLKSFCVGYPLEFEIKDIDGYCLINRILTNADIVKLKEILVSSHIKGLVFDDLGLILALKDLNVPKILMLTHLGNSLRSITKYLKFVDTVMISTDLAYEEIAYILNNTSKPLVLFTFGLVPLMYSRRMLLTNYALNANVPIQKEITSHINEKFFQIVENDYGTVFYTGKYFLNKEADKFPNVYAEYYNPLFLSDEKIKAVLDDNYTDIDAFTFLLDKKTMYKLKEED